MLSVISLLNYCPMSPVDLDEMSHGLTRLKNLGRGLQSEIEDQNDSIDSLLNRVDKMDVKIHNTNQQIKKL